MTTALDAQDPKRSSESTSRGRRATHDVWDEYGSVISEFVKRPRRSIRFYLEAGVFENTYHPSVLMANRHLRTFYSPRDTRSSMRNLQVITARLIYAEVWRRR
jgi:hypothetical protein